MTNTQIDHLGERLKKGINDADLRLLDNYRRSFTEAYEATVDIIRHRLGLSPTGRPAKSTRSIIDKLKRESIRLTQMQDIAGCRLIVSNIAQQERVVNSIRDCFDNVRVIDRRKKPSYGYRAVHLIIKWHGKIIEVQVRTSLQHLWAEFSEKLSDEDPLIKYGGGSKRSLQSLYSWSKLLADIESLEIDAAKELQAKVEIARKAAMKLLKNVIAELESDEEE